MDDGYICGKYSLPKLKRWIEHVNMTMVLHWPSSMCQHDVYWIWVSWCKLIVTFVDSNVYLNLEGEHNKYEKNVTFAYNKEVGCPMFVKWQQ